MKQLLAVAAVLALVPSAAVAQGVSPIQRLFEAGKHAEVVKAAPADAPPSVLFLVGLSHERLRAKDPARETFGRLASRPDTDPWHFTGESARKLVDGDIGNEREWLAWHEEALKLAEQGAKLGPTLMEAHYQVGRVLAAMSSWADAATAFDRAAELNPTFAYAHYFSGMAYFRGENPDRMVEHFEAFLKLAPEAPERSQVQNLMKSGGR
jgi:tetratricopeptide (TPR) repeat protein